MYLTKKNLAAIMFSIICHAGSYATHHGNIEIRNNVDQQMTDLLSSSHKDYVSNLEPMHTLLFQTDVLNALGEEPNHLEINGTMHKYIRKLMYELVLARNLVREPNSKCEKILLPLTEITMSLSSREIWAYNDDSHASLKCLTTFLTSFFALDYQDKYGINPVVHNYTSGDIYVKSISTIENELKQKMIYRFIGCGILCLISILTSFSSNQHILKSILENGAALGSLGVLCSIALPSVVKIIDFQNEKKAFEKGLRTSKERLKFIEERVLILNKLLNPKKYSKEKSIG